MVVTAQDLVKVCKIYSTINKQIISCVNISGECEMKFFRSRLWEKSILKIRRVRVHLAKNRLDEMEQQFDAAPFYLIFVCAINKIVYATNKWGCFF